MKFRFFFFGVCAHGFSRTRRRIPMGIRPRRRLRTHSGIRAKKK
jgi:hypothetical protein